MTTWRSLLLPALLVCAGLAAASCGTGGEDGTATASFELMLRLDEASVPRIALERKRTDVCHALEAAGIAFKSATIEDASAVLLRGLSGETLVSARSAAREAAGSFDVEAEGGGALRVGLPADRTSMLASARAETLRVLEARLLGLGLVDARVDPSPDDPQTFVVTVEASAQPPDVVTRMLTAPTTLRWHELAWPTGVEDPASWLPPASEAEALAMFDGELPPNVVLMPQTLRADDGGQPATVYWAVREIPVLTAADIVRAEAVERADGVPSVEFELSAEAAARFERVTRENTGRKMAIALRDQRADRIRSTPVIRGPIGSHAVIAGDLSMAEARGLSLVLTSGTLPARLEVTALGSR